MSGDTPVPRRNQFGQAARLKRAWEFERTRTGGERLAKGCLIFNWRAGSNDCTIPRLGVITSKKIGGAVERSRARRLLREAFRLHKRKLLPAEIVLVARPSIVEKQYFQVERDFIMAARQAKLLRERE